MSTLNRKVSPRVTSLTAVPRVSQVELSWPAPQDCFGAVTQVLTRSPAFAGVVTPTARDYTDTTVATGQSYTYSLTVIDGRGLSSAPVFATAFIPSGPGGDDGDFPVKAVYDSYVTLLGGTPVSSITNPRYWSQRPAIPTIGTPVTQAQLASAITNAQNGGVVRLADGVYNNLTVNLNRSNITLAAETQNGVIFTGTSNIACSGNNNDILGFKWLDSLRTGGNAVALSGSNNRLMLCTFDGAESSANNSSVVGLTGTLNRVAFNTFARGTSLGRYVHCQGTLPVPTYCRIDHNKLYFKSGGVATVDDTEFIQVGQNQADTDYFTLIDRNHFYRYRAGDLEMISIKAGAVMWINNAQEDCGPGRWNFREASRALIMANFVEAAGNPDAGGFNLLGSDNYFLCNYLRSLNSAALQSVNGWGLSLGVGGSGSFGAAHNAKVAFNTFSNCKFPIAIGLGGQGTIAPTGLRFHNNVVEHAGTGDSISIGLIGTLAGAGNTVEPPVGDNSNVWTADTPDLTFVFFALPTIPGNLIGNAQSGYTTLATHDAIGTPIPSVGAHRGCFQVTTLDIDPMQQIIAAAGA